MAALSYGEWRRAGLLGRLIGYRRYRARFRCIGPALAQSSWVFDGYDYE
jgi:hypothetical protein